MQIIKITLYNVPYTEDDYHQPSRTDLPDEWTPIATFDKINARPINFGKSIDLATSYDIIRNANYGEFTVCFDDHDEIYYAWIDNITTSSIQNEGSTHLSYHWDYWRTFVEKIKFIRATITNRPSSNNDPPQYANSFRETFSEIVEDIHLQHNHVAWVFCAVLAKAGEQGIKRYAFPINRLSYDSRIKITDGSINGQTPTFKDIINGTFLTVLKIPKEKIIGINIGSVSPIDCEITQNVTDLNDITIKINYEPKIYSYEIPTFDMVTPEHYHSNGEIVSDNEKGRFNIFNYDTSKTQNNLKKWCYPYTEHNFKNSSAMVTRNFATIVPASPLVYFPILMRLKYYSREYDNIKSIKFNERECLFGECNWIISESTKEKIVYNQSFTIVPGIYIKSVSNLNQKTDTCDIHLSDGNTLINHSILNVLMLREGNPDTGFKNYEIRIEKLNTQDYHIEKIENESTIYHILNNDSGIWPEITYKNELNLSSTPTKKLILADNNGYPINCFQQKHIIKGYTTQMITQNNIMYCLICFNSLYGYIENNEFEIPLTSIDLTQEYFNEYVTSLERESANAKRTENIISSIADMAGTAAIGTMLAGPAGGVVGGATALSKTILGGALTSGVLGGILGQYHQYETDNRLKKMGSKLIANGNDYSWTSIGFNIALINTEIDAYSQTEFNKNISEYGITCNEIDLHGFTCNNILLDGGPLKLSSVTLDIGIPIDANRYIKNKLLSGVYIDHYLSKMV